MDASGLDGVSRRLAQAKSRRGMLKALLGFASGATAAVIPNVVRADDPLPEVTTTAAPSTTSAPTTTTTPSFTTPPPITTSAPTTTTTTGSPATTTKRPTTTTPPPSTTTKKPTTTTSAPQTTTKKPTTTTKKPTTTTKAPSKPVIAVGSPDIWCGPDAHRISGTIAIENPQDGATILVQLLSRAGLGAVQSIPLSTGTDQISFSFDIPGWIPWVSDWIAVQVTTGWSTAWGQNLPTFRGFREPSNHVAVDWEAGQGSSAICEIS